MENGGPGDSPVASTSRTSSRTVFLYHKDTDFEMISTKIEKRFCTEVPKMLPEERCSRWCPARVSQSGLFAHTALVDTLPAEVLVRI